MKKIIYSFLFTFLITSPSFSQIDDILKKIPGVGDVFKEAVTTSIKDAYPSAYWLKDLDKQLPLNGGVTFSSNLPAGYYRYRCNTFCLHAGTYAPTEGAGYLVAPLKGSKAKLIKDILVRYSEHPEIDQKDVQLLLWGIEAGQKFSSYPPDFQLRVQPLLKPEEIGLMEVDVKQIGMDLLPQEVKDVLNLYTDIRTKLSDVNSTYEDIERLAVKTGIAPLGKGSKNIEAGVWTSVGGGVYIRCFPEGYPKSEMEIYIPDEVDIKKDNSGNVISFDNGSNQINLTYEPGSDKFKTAVIKNIAGSEEISIDNNSDPTSMKKDSEDFISLVKKSLGRKKSKRLTGSSVKLLSQLKAIEYSLSSTDKTGLLSDGYTLSVNAIGSFISDIETGNKKGGGQTHEAGLGNVNGLVFAPANTSNQRLGNGGPEGGTPSEGGPNEGNPPKEKEKEKKDCKVSMTLMQVDQSKLPEPDWVYSVTAQIYIEGNDEECNAEEVQFTLIDVSKERGRCLNDMEKIDDVDEDLQFSTLNEGYTMTKTTASKKISGKSQPVEINIACSDYGAYGKLKASVKVKGNWYEADGDGTPDKFITIPVDLNNNQIADSWEKKNNVYGLPNIWDEDPTPSGQANTGDGITNYEEYRGFFVSDGGGGKEHVRTDPKLKELFVYDKDKIFDIASWKSASGIKAYWVDLDMMYGPKGGGETDQNYRWVNFCRGFATGLKYAIQVVKINGMGDPYNQHQEKYVFGYNDPAYGPPKASNRIVMFPDRIRNWLVESADTLEGTLKKFPSGFNIGTVYYSKKEVQHLIDEIRNSAKLDVLVDFWLNLCVLHETGHACNCHHHGGGDPNKTGLGDPKCPTLYRSEYTLVKLDKMMAQVMNVIEKEGITPIVSYTGWKFCTKGDNCWKQLTVNDSK
ncbi:MAG TPA: hypothetical protein VGK25_04710 [Ignavibacteria bacterium]|jgi:hypothetical protein